MVHLNYPGNKRLIKSFVSVIHSISVLLVVSNGFKEVNYKIQFIYMFIDYSHGIHYEDNIRIFNFRQFSNYSFININ